jgi:hypothetical protein
LAEPILAPASLETQRRGDPNLAPLRLGASLPSATLFTMAPSHSPLSEKQIRLRLSFSVSSMDFSYERFFVVPLNYIDLAIRASGQGQGLPERYTSSAFSRMRTSLDVLKFVEQRFGWESVVRTLRQFGMPIDALKNGDSFISLRFLTELCDHLETRGMTYDDFVSMGQYSLSVNQGEDRFRALRDCRSARELYDLQVNHLMGSFDLNYSYSTSRLSSNYCLIEMAENREIANELGAAHLGSKTTCATKVGRAAAIAGFGGFSHSRVVETHCVHRGDPVCRLHVEFAPAKLRVSALDH